MTHYGQKLDVGLRPEPQRLGLTIFFKWMKYFL